MVWLDNYFISKIIPTTQPRYNSDNHDPSGRGQNVRIGLETWVTS